MCGVKRSKIMNGNVSYVIKKIVFIAVIFLVMTITRSKHAMAEIGPGIWMTSSGNGSPIYAHSKCMVKGVSRTDEVNVSEVSAGICVRINEIRAEYGLRPYLWNDRLAQDASIRCIEVMTNWSHTRPDGSDWWTLDPECMYGEILAKGYRSAETVVNAWMDSATHKEEILRSDCAYIGLSMQKCEIDGLWYYAVSFM